ncbi:alpha-galactosidase [Streptomyces spongiicola]|uniref:alpha-galactosidase n=1 Tax=Streptomyces spongiicola TaxID=1690221 RepID=A0A2S1Z892_9ACTN|nr:alpha-galactosidase [Streptomyces spongiicola]AWK12108.1 alpha-galactosidase [Streptomyces spongiicola]GBQ02696.1 alpha-galactosidase [Streptomyces spongiicola]
MTTDRPPSLLHFRAAGTSLLVDCSGTRLPRILHWGADLGEHPGAGSGGDGLAALAAAGLAQLVTSVPDVPVPVAVLPEQSAGWLGTPGLSGHREGAGFSPAFTVRALDTPAPRRLTVRADDARTRLGLRLELELTPSGLVRQRAALTNEADTPYTVDALHLTLPVPAQATELLDLTGRHLRERSPQRHAFTLGTHLRENRRGRTGLDATLVHVAGEQGFGFRGGEVWGLHIAWSGNHRSFAERTNSGVSLLGGGELLLPGEMVLEPGATCETPWLLGSYGSGLDEMAGRFHTHLRARPHHPAAPRPVTLNTWEAVYFRHELTALTALADAAAEVGAERFVLDDGWFRGRRDDRAGLGDWWVDPEVWPEGLHPLVRHVRSRGLQFGLWVEPEMVNPDSDLARAHPEWILSAAGRMPPEARHQQVLNLADPDAYAHVLDRLDSLVGEYAIDYLKWDHNRDLVDAGAGPRGSAGVHAQTTAVYALMDELRRRRPGLEIESCSSGGARVDLGILERADRVWTSDCNDALERQRIQRWTGLLLPPELMGAHVGPPVTHTTGRAHGLDFRAGTALFGHLGIEWDLARASAEERRRLAEWIAAHKRLRPLLHTGTVVHADHPDPALLVHGVVAPDRSHAVYALVQTATSVQAPAGRVRLPGLAEDAHYSVAPLAPGDVLQGPVTGPLAWWDSGGVELSGRALDVFGVQAPTLDPERLVLVEARRIGH